MLSIITPILNGAAYIKENIESIMSLEIPHEHIIVDGGSTDGTLDILSAYPNVKILHQEENSGMYGAINQGISFAKGEFISYVNCDDKVVKKGFQQMYEQISSGMNIDLIYSDAKFYFIDTQRYKFIKGHSWPKYFLRKGIMPFVQPSSIFKKQKYLDIGGFRYDKFKLYGDLDLFQRMALSDAKLLYLPQVSTIFMMRTDSLAHKYSEKGKEELPLLNNYEGNKKWVKILFKMLR